MTTGQLPTDQVTPPVGNQPATPASATPPQSEDPATEAARLRKENEDLAKRIADKDTHINELSTEKATLEQRLSYTQPAAPATPGSVPAQPAAPAGGTNVSEFVRPEDVPEIVERNTFVNKMKADNEDMMNLGLEPVITFRANELMAKGKGFKESVTTAINEQREKLNKFKSPTAAGDQPPPPAGARGEDGASAPATPKAPVVDVLADEGDERKKARAKKGL